MYIYIYTYINIYIYDIAIILVILAYALASGAFGTGAACEGRGGGGEDAFPKNGVWHIHVVLCYIKLCNNILLHSILFYYIVLNLKSSE